MDENIIHKSQNKSPELEELLQIFFILIEKGNIYEKIILSKNLNNTDYYKNKFKTASKKTLNGYYKNNLQEMKLGINILLKISLLINK